MTPYQVTLALPPTTNQLYRFVPGLPRPIKSRAYRDWQRLSALTSRKPKEPFRRPVRVIIAASGLDHRQDVDNLAKPAIDFLVDAGVVRSDRVGWVSEVVVRGTTAGHPQLVITVEELEGHPPEESPAEKVDRDRPPPGPPGAAAGVRTRVDR